MASSDTTVDHKTIQQWADARGGKAVSVRGTGSEDEAGILRIDFPGEAGSDRLEEVTWEEWFAKFDENDLAFLYQDKTAGGEESRFFKLVKREGAGHAKNGKDTKKQ